MAGKKIGELPKQSEFLSSDLLLVEQNGVTKSAAISDLKKIMKGEQGTPGTGARIDDNSVREDATWSSDKIASHVGVHVVEASGTSIYETGTVVAPFADIEILGNTTQNTTNLADIRSVGTIQKDGRYKFGMSCQNKNLNTMDIVVGMISTSTGELNTVVDSYYSDKSYTRIPSNESISVSCDKLVETIFFYDEKKSYISSMLIGYTSKVVTTPSRARYMRIRFLKEHKPTWIQVEKGSQTSPYVEPQCSTLPIYLPCSLEKVGIVSDKVYYDNLEKAWCVLKNTINSLLNGSEPGWKLYTPSDAANINTICFEIGKADKFSNPDDKSLNILSNILPAISAGDSYSRDIEGIADRYDLVRVKINRSRLATPDLVGFKNWLSKNNMVVKYQLNTPQKIVLPKDTQISFNSYLGHTNVYSVDTEVEPIIKVKMSKSIGASVQNTLQAVNVLSKRVSDIETLKESQDMRYQSSRGYLVCDNTKQGIVNKLRVFGKTMNNLAYDVNYYVSTSVENEGKYEFIKGINYLKYTVTQRLTQWHYISLGQFSIKQFKPDTEYTIMIREIQADNRYYLAIASADFTQIIADKILVKDGKAVLRTKSSFEGITKPMEIYINPPSEVGVLELADVVIYEGNFIDREYEYHKGVASVGSSTGRINVSTTNDNIFNLESVTSVDKGTFKDNEFTSEPLPNWGWIRLGQSGMSLRKGTYYVSVDTRVDSGTYSKTLNCILPHTSANVANADVIVTPTSVRPFIDGSYQRSTWKWEVKRRTNIDKIFIQIQDTATSVVLKARNLRVSTKMHDDYLPQQKVERAVLYKDNTGQYVPIPELLESDLLDMTNNKWYKRSGKMTLSGGSNEVYYSSPTAPVMVDTLVFQVLDRRFKPKSKVICEGYPSTTLDMWSRDEPSVWINQDGVMYFRVLKSQLSTQDVAGFKKWLADRNRTIVYTLYTEEVYPILPVTLDCYEDVTIMQFDGGLISPQSEWSMSSYISNIVKDTVKRVSAIENGVFNMFRSVLAGDYKSVAVGLYPQDFIPESPK